MEQRGSDEGKLIKNINIHYKDKAVEVEKRVCREINMSVIGQKVRNWLINGLEAFCVLKAPSKSQQKFNMLFCLKIKYKHFFLLPSE